MVILINPFRVFEGQEEAFLALWDATGAIFRASEGYIAAKLCRALPEQPRGQHAPFTHVNVAEWESAGAYERALRQPALAPFVARYRAVSTFDPALYEIIRAI